MKLKLNLFNLLSINSWFIFNSFLLISSDLSISHCPENIFFDCGNEKCIAPFFVCDGDNDCGNFLDETNCHLVKVPVIKSNCSRQQFACNDENGVCIPQRWVCDGTPECQNNSDEENCDNSKIDCKDDFKCEQGVQCISKNWRCDGIEDCIDGSDEKNCTFSKDELCDKKHNKYQCMVNNKCVDFVNVCDGKKDCPLGDDEADYHCHQHKCKDKCSHSCYIDPDTKDPVCSCPPGFNIVNDDTCVDYDECGENKILNLCSQKCINLEGHFKCECNNGYRLVNETRCEAEGASPLLYYSTGIDIHASNTRELFLFPVVEQSDHTPIIVAMDVFVKRKKLYYSVFVNDTSMSSIYEIAINPDSIVIQNEKRLFYQDKSQIEGLSVDWLANNIYLTEFNKRRIMVCCTEKLICATLIDNLNNPRGILALPTKGKLFWSQWGDNNGIFEARMDGKEITKLFYDVDWPNDLVYDEESNRLYWCEGKLGKIEYYDFDTEIRHVVYEDVLKQPYSLFVFEDTLYWTDWSFQKLVACEKINCHHQTTIFQPTIIKGRGLYGISMYHPLLQTTSNSINPCKNNPCSHLCLIKSNNSYSCFCPDHTYLSNDNKTCVNKPDNSFMIVNTGFKLFKYYPDSLMNSFEEIPMLPMFSISDLAYNAEREEVFLHDRFKDRIMMMNVRNDTNHHYTKITVLVDNDLASVFGLTYDINTDNVYWVDMNKETLEVVSVRNGRRAILNDKLDQPISLALNAPTKTFYVGLKTKHAQIVSLTMDGQFIKTILKTTVGLPMAMVVHPNLNELIWADPIIQKIDFINFNLKASNNHHLAHKLAEKHVGTVHSLATNDSHLFWTNADSPNLYYTSLTSSIKNIGWKRIPDMNFDNDVLRVVSGDKQKRLYDYCIKSNPCQHICLIGKYGPKCKCSLGYELTENERNCIKNQSSLAIKPIINILSLDKIFDFILSKQKDQILDTWMGDDEDNEDETESPILPSKPINETKIAESKASSLQIEFSNHDDENSSNGNFIFVWVIIILLLVIIIFLCIKLQVLQSRAVRSVVTFVSDRIPIKHNLNNDNFEQSKQVRFVTNPNYNPHYIPKRNQPLPPLPQQQITSDEELLVQ